MRSKNTEGGFSDIDGFSETDMYACGKNGDLWHYNDTVWEKIEMETNTGIPKLCCASDGFVYAITDSRHILKGRGDRWQFISQDATTDIMEEIVCFNDKVIISTEKGLFEMKGDALVPADLNVPSMKAYNHIAAGDGILVVLGGNEAQMFDGEKWTQILEPPK